MKKSGDALIKLINSVKRLKQAKEALRQELATLRYGKVLQVKVIQEGRQN